MSKTVSLPLSMRLSGFAERTFLPLAPVLTRLVVGFGFFRVGLGKWQDPGRVAEFFTSVGIPFPKGSAALVATLELLGGAALLIGFKTRLFAALLSCVMVVALGTAERQAFLLELSFDGQKGLWGVVPFVTLLLLAWLLAGGAGPVSVDRWFLRRQAARAFAGI